MTIGSRRFMAISGVILTAVLFTIAVFVHRGSGAADLKGDGDGFGSITAFLAGITLIAILAAMVVTIIVLRAPRGERGHSVFFTFAAIVFAFRMCLYLSIDFWDLFEHELSTVFPSEMMARLSQMTFVLCSAFMVECYGPMDIARIRKIVNPYRILAVTFAVVVCFVPEGFLNAFELVSLLIAAAGGVILVLAAESRFVNDFRKNSNALLNAAIFFVCLSAEAIYSIYAPGMFIGFIGFFSICVSLVAAVMHDYHQSKLSLRRLRDSLEYEVANRTNALMIANKQLDSEIAARRKTEEDLILISTTDYLTGTVNRMQGQKTLDEFYNLYRRYGTIYSMLLLDIDNFKNINDKYGHDVGDKTLVTMTANVQKMIRNTDTLTRWGGEEFVVILPGCDLNAAIKTADKIRRHVASLEFEGPGTVTISIGVSEITPGDDNGTLAKRADENLYKAKRSGKNCTFPKIG